MGVLIVYDGAHLTVGASSEGGCPCEPCESMNLVGDVSLTVSHTDASGNEEQVLEVHRLDRISFTCRLHSRK